LQDALGGDDFIVGRGADDDLSGGRGDDFIEGRSGPDYIVGGRGVDEHYSQGGNDRIEAADGKRDFVNCGSGEYDRASVDADEDVQDVVKNCEIVNGQPVVAPE
jgi:Ca2+-binding RTX toxin-like protein